jgi:hypothetical protein
MANRDTQFQDAPPQDYGSDPFVSSDPFGLNDPNQTTPSDASRPMDNQQQDVNNFAEAAPAPEAPKESSAWSDVAQSFDPGNTNQTSESNPWAGLSSSQDQTRAENAPTPPPEPAPVEQAPEQQAWANLKTTDTTPAPETPQISSAGQDVMPGEYNPQGVVDEANKQTEVMQGFDTSANDLNQKRVDLEARWQQYVDEINTGVGQPDLQFEASIQGEDRALRGEEDKWMADHATQTDRMTTMAADARATIDANDRQLAAGAGVEGIGQGFMGLVDASQQPYNQQVQAASGAAYNLGQTDEARQVYSQMVQDPQKYFESLGMTPSNEVTLPNGQVVSRLDDGHGYSTWTLPGHDDPNVAGYWQDSAGNWNPGNAQDLTLLSHSGFKVTSKANAESIAGQAFQSTGTQPADLIKGYSEAYQALSSGGVTNTLLTPLGKAALATLNTRAGQAAELIVLAATMPSGAGLSQNIAAIPAGGMGIALREAVKDTVMLSLRDALKAYLISGPDLGLQGVGWRPAEWLGIQDKGIAAPPIGMLMDAITKIEQNPSTFAAMVQDNRNKMPAESLRHYVSQIGDALFTDNPEDVARQKGLAQTFTNVDPAFGIGGRVAGGGKALLSPGQGLGAQGVAVLTSMLIGDVQNRTQGWKNINPFNQFNDYLARGKQNMAAGMSPSQSYQKSFDDSAQDWARIFWEFNLRNPAYNVIQSPKLEDFAVRAFGTGQRGLAEFGKWSLEHGLALPGAGTYGERLKVASDQTAIFFRRLAQEAGLNAVGGKLGEGLQHMLPYQQLLSKSMAPDLAKKIEQDAAKNISEMVLAKVRNDDATYIDAARHHMNFFNGVPGVTGSQHGIETLVDSMVDGIRVDAAKAGITPEAYARALQDRVPPS